VIAPENPDHSLHHLRHFQTLLVGGEQVGYPEEHQWAGDSHQGLLFDRDVVFCSWKHFSCFKLRTMSQKIK
jgi:hypothetical protein